MPNSFLKGHFMIFDIGISMAMTRILSLSLRLSGLNYY